MVTTVAVVRVLLTDGSGLTSRQVAGRLAASGHEVHVLAPSPLVLTRFTRSVRRVHRAPAYGADPWRWLEEALRIARRERIEVLFPTQEQVAVLARAVDRVARAGVRTAVPSFDALRSVLDKVSAARTLARLHLPVPETTVASSGADLAAVDGFPVYLKAPIGTAGRSVARANGAGDMPLAARRVGAAEAFGAGGVVVQRALAGPLVMVQAVFDGGRPIAAHANLRSREGVGGGASSKESVDLPEVRDHLLRLGSALAWHGALSLDAILAVDGVRYIDVNPRLVEPFNAWRSGTDLVGAMLALSRGEHPPAQRPGRPGVRTHQVLLAVLAAAQRRGRRAIAEELLSAALRRGPYAGSVEELTPLRGDPRSAIPVALAAASTLIRPGSYRAFTGEAVGAYALTSAAWDLIVAGSPGRRAPAT